MGLAIRSQRPQESPDRAPEGDNGFLARRDQIGVWRIRASVNGRSVKFHDFNGSRPLTRITSWESRNVPALHQPQRVRCPHDSRRCGQHGGTVFGHGGRFLDHRCVGAGSTAAGHRTSAPGSAGLGLPIDVASPELWQGCSVENHGGVTLDDVVIDDYDEILWRLRSLYGLKNFVGQQVCAISPEYAKPRYDPRHLCDVVGNRPNAPVRWAAAAT